MDGTKTIAIVGATGLVGSEMVSILAEQKIRFKEVRLLASKESAGEVYSVGEHESVVEPLSESSFAGVDIALFATSAELSAEFVPVAVEAGATVIDNSSHFRMDQQVPLLVPEVNAAIITGQHKIIANPNCSTIQLVPVLDLINKLAGLERVVVSTYQSVSGAGKGALDELWEQLLAVFNQREMPTEELGATLAFNLIPQIDRFDSDDYTREELKIIRETRKILSLPELRITATAVRVPVLHSHSESVNVETRNPLTPETLLAELERQPWARVYRGTDYPLPLDSAGQDSIDIGRVRVDQSVKHGLNLWIVSDNLRKGAALNAVQIAQLVMARSSALH